MAADTLSTDGWNLADYVTNKIFVGPDFLLGGAGDYGPLLKYYRHLEETGNDALTVIKQGILDFDRDKADVTCLLVTKEEGVPVIFRSSQGQFFRSGRTKMAIGSGRDYALAFMFCDMDAVQTIESVKFFDTGTSGSIMTYTLEACRDLR